MADYVEDKLKCIEIPKSLTGDSDAKVSEELHSAYRGAVGGLLWLERKGQPLLSFDVSMLSSKVSSFVFL